MSTRLWTPTQHRHWRERIEHLADAIGCDKPIKVRRVPLSRWLGDCEDAGDHYLVRIANHRGLLWRDLSYQHAVYVLHHELAHAIEPNDHEHGIAWGAAFAEVWRADAAWENDED